MTLGLDSARDAILLTPKSEPNADFPLLVCFNGVGHRAGHGTGQGADEMFEYLGRLGTAPEEAGVAVLAPNSRDNTWDAISGSFGPDVKFLNRAGSIQIRRCQAAGSRAVLRTATITIVSPSTEK